MRVYSLYIWGCHLTLIEKINRCVKVQFEHLGYTRRYKVLGLSTQPLSELKLGDGKKSGVEYFLEKYKIRLQHTFIRPYKPVIMLSRLCCQWTDGALQHI